MGSRGSARVKKPKKKSKWSAQEKVEGARVGAATRRVARTRPFGSPALTARLGMAKVRRRYRRNPLPRANRSR